MINRGHIRHTLGETFNTESIKAQRSSLPIVTLKPKDTLFRDTDHNKDLYIHLPHHPNNPTTLELRNLTNILKDAIKPEIDINRVIIAFSKAPNIGDICKKQQLEYYIDTNTPNAKR